MRLSEKYLQKRLVTVMPPGESWSAYEWEALDEEDVKIYGRICFLEGIISVDPINREVIGELEKISKVERLDD
jgi:hypothetical protein